MHGEKCTSYRNLLLSKTPGYISDCKCFVIQEVTCKSSVAPTDDFCVLEIASGLKKVGDPWSAMSPVKLAVIHYSLHKPVLYDYYYFTERVESPPPPKETK